MTTTTTSGRLVRTVGVEEELLLVDAGTMTPAPVAQAVLTGAGVLGRLPAVDAAVDAAGPSHAPTMEFEVKHEQIEVIGPPLTTFEEVFAGIRAGRVEADAAARAIGARAVALATAPPVCEPHLVDAPRYELMQERFGHTLREQLTCGFHVHVSVGSDEEGVAVLDRIRPWLPVLLAFSANSPFWQGVDTGFASFRYQAWSRWPTAGAYDIIGSPEAYAEHCRMLLDTEVPVDTGMIYFDARLSPHVPTVETRIADVCLRPVDAAVLAVITRALVETAAAEWEAGIPPDPVPTSLLRLASWRASKSGVRDTLVHPVTRTPVPAEVGLEALLGHVGGHFADRDEELMVRAAVASALRDGCGATRQRRAMAAHGDCAGVVAEALRESLADSRADTRGDTRSSTRTDTLRAQQTA